jgi:ankyrin repeat protein
MSRSEISIPEKLKLQLEAYCNMSICNSKTGDRLGSDSFESRLDDKGRFYDGELKYGKFEKGNKYIDINDAIDLQGNTPLHIAAKCNNVEVFIKLFNAGAKVDIKNNQGQLAMDIIQLEENRAIDEALLKCCKENNEKLVSFLIILGADVNYENKEGRKPLDCLIKDPDQSTEKIARLLIEHGAVAGENKEKESTSESTVTSSHFLYGSSNGSPRSFSSLEQESPNPSPKTLSALRSFIEEKLRINSSTRR